MEVKPSPALWLYRMAWEPALWLVKFLAGLEILSRRDLWPARWRLAERLGWKWPPKPQSPPERPAFWMHAASLGECKGLWALAQSLDDLPESFVLTANTTTGLEFLLRRIESAKESNRWRALLAPLDHPKILERFLNRFQIKALLLFEVELWPHFVLTVRRKTRPVYWVSARLTPRARRSYALFPGALYTVLSGVSWVQAQGKEDVETFKSRGCASVEVGADLRGLHYLNAPAPRIEALNWNQREGIAFVSLHAAELPCLLQAIQSLRDNLPLFVFPRKMEELPIFRNALESMGFALHSKHPENRRLIVDSFGRVAGFLEHCHSAVVGGSFTRHGGHNLWEPLISGTGMIIGRHHWNQVYLVRKLEASGLLRISDAPLNGDLLRKSSVDPVPAYIRFMAEESYILQQAALEIKKQLRAADLVLCP